MVLLSIIGIIVCFLFLLKIYRKLTLNIYKSNTCMVGKTVIVTGGDDGIGFEAAKDLAGRGARVIIACRDIQNGMEAREKIIKYTGNNNVIHHQLDLAKFRSIRKFCDGICGTERRLDVLINSADYCGLGNKKTEDGNHIGMQVNYFGPFLMTNLLLPLLKSTAPSRIVNVSSVAHRYGEMDFENLNMERYWSDVLAYANSKLFINLMTLELARRLKETGVTVNALQPGAVATNIFRNVKNEKIRYLIKLFSEFFYYTVLDASQTLIYLSVVPEVSDMSGRYFYNCREKLPSKVARDPEIAKKLWDETEKIIENSSKLK